MLDKRYDFRNIAGLAGRQCERVEVTKDGNKTDAQSAKKQGEGVCRLDSMVENNDGYEDESEEDNNGYRVIFEDDEPETREEMDKRQFWRDNPREYLGRW